MGGRLTTPPSSESSSSTTTAHRLPGSDSSSTNLNSSAHAFQAAQQQVALHRHHSSGAHHTAHGLFSDTAASHGRHRHPAAHLDPIGATAFNLNLLRYMGLEHESDDQSTDEDSPQTHRRLQHFFISIRDVPCPVCNKTIPSDSFEKHILHCLSKPRIDYNGWCTRPSRDHRPSNFSYSRGHVDGGQR